ncbi:MAG: 50S ribosomal protein L15 [Myxococcales bacterium]|nr:50S ribosomal protein L15 [Myxococcales bacterium]
MADEEKYVPILSRLSPPEGAVRRKKRKGRGIGSGLGKTAGKGMKGQKARHGNNFGKIGFEGGQTPLYRRLPKRGFTNIFAKKVAVLNVAELGKRFDAGATVDLDALRGAGLLKRDVDVVKVLGDGDLDKALTVKVHAFSASAKEKIEKAGGTVEVLA